MSLIFTLFTLCWLAMAAELIKRPEEKKENSSEVKEPNHRKETSKKRKITFKDLAPQNNIDIKKRPSRSPASVYKPYRGNSTMYLYGACRDSFGRFHGPRDPDYQYCMDDFPPFDGFGPFGKRKFMGVGIFIHD